MRGFLVWLVLGLAPGCSILSDVDQLVITTGDDLVVTKDTADAGADAGAEADGGVDAGAGSDTLTQP